SSRRRRGLPWPFTLRQSPAAAPAPGQAGSGCSRALFGQPLAALCGEAGTLPRPIQVGQPGQGSPSPPCGCSRGSVPSGSGGGWGTGLFTHGHRFWRQTLCGGGGEPSLGQSSGLCRHLFLQPSSCPPASPAGAPGHPVPERTVDGGDLPQSRQRDSAPQAEGGPRPRRRCGPGKPACHPASCHLEGERFCPAAGRAPGWPGIFKGSPEALGLAGLSAQHPRQAPRCRPLPGLDASHGEAKQGGQGGSAES
ncbi:unnamed protein product, partial [Bubo scandiacus]